METRKKHLINVLVLIGTVLVAAFIVVFSLIWGVNKAYGDTVYKCRGSDYIGEPRVGSSQDSKNNVFVKKEGDCVKLSSSDNSFVVIYYALQARRSDRYKIKASYECNGKTSGALITALYADSDKEENSPSLYLNDNNDEAIFIPNERTNKFIRDDGTIQLAVSVSDGQGIIVKSLEIQYLDAEPQTYYINCSRQSLPYGYTSWNAYYRGPVYYSYSYSSSSYGNGGYSYSVYKSWSSSDGYSSWSSSYSSSYSSMQEYSYSYTNNTVSYIPVEPARCRIMRHQPNIRTRTIESRGVVARRNQSDNSRQRQDVAFNQQQTQEQQANPKKLGYTRFGKKQESEQNARLSPQNKNRQVEQQQDQQNRPSWLKKQKQTSQENRGASPARALEPLSRASVAEQKQVRVKQMPESRQASAQQELRQTSRQTQQRQEPTPTPAPVAKQAPAPSSAPIQATQQAKDDDDKDKQSQTNGDSGQRKRIRSR